MDWVNNAWNSATSAVGDFFEELGTAASNAYNDVTSGNYIPGVPFDPATEGVAAPDGGRGGFFSEFNNAIDNVGNLFDGLGDTAGTLFSIFNKLLEVIGKLLDMLAVVLPYVPFILVGFLGVKAAEVVTGNGGNKTVIEVDSNKKK